MLSASSDWKLREMDDCCRLSHRFGTGENRIVMWLGQGGAEPIHNPPLIGHRFRHFDGQFAQIRFGPGEASNIRGYMSAEPSTDRPVMMMRGVELAPQERDPEKPAQPIEDFNPKREDAITQLDILRAFRDPVLFDLGSMGEPLDRSRSCATLLGAKLTTTGLITCEKRRPATALNEADWARHIHYPR